MKFVYPEFLFGLLAIAIPVIIHLFSFRKFKRIYFTNVRFLEEIKQEKQSKSKLKHLLVLLSRILAIIFLVLAFAQPYFPISDTKIPKGGNITSVFVDNSFSMEAAGKNGTLLEEAKQRAREIAAAYKPSDRFQLLTNDFTGRQQALLSKEDFLQTLEEVKLSPNVQSVSEIILRQKEAVNEKFPGKSFDAFIISDFQKSITDLEKLKADSNVNINLITVKSENSNNLSIDSCWFESPVRQLNRTLELKVRVKNYGGSDVENVPLKLMVNGVQKSLGSVNVSAGNEFVATLNFTINGVGFQRCEVQITDYPVTFDDKFYFSFETGKPLNVVSVFEKAPNIYVRAVFAGDSAFWVKEVNVSQIDYSLLNKANLVILTELKSISSGLSDELKKYVASGGSLLIFPDMEADLPSYNSLLKSLGTSSYQEVVNEKVNVLKINTDNPVFKNVFEKVPENLNLPVVLRHFQISRNIKSNSEVLIRMEGGNPFLTQFNISKGKVFLFASSASPEASSFPKHSLFVPAIYNIALNSSNPQPLFYSIGQNETIESSIEPGSDKVLHLVRKDFDIIPQLIPNETGNAIILNLHNQVKEAGMYELVNKQALQGVYAFNYDRRESETAKYSSSDLEDLASKSNLANVNALSSGEKQITASVKELNMGIRLWKACIILALLFLGLEILLIKFLK